MLLRASSLYDNSCVHVCVCVALHVSTSERASSEDTTMFSHTGHELKCHEHVFEHTDTKHEKFLGCFKLDIQTAALL